jgi:NAD(P)-dependent dehydrogenase (short-subunit alcohol dehydrogenase family)
MSYAGFDLHGKLAVVVGGTSGIGRAIGKGLAQAGADVVPTARRRETVEEAASEVESLGRRSLRVYSDVTDRNSLQQARDAILKEFTKVDILVYASGTTIRRPFLEVPEAEWQKILATNLTGAYHACQIFGEHMVKRGYGRVINIASLASFVGLNEVAAYGASKAGLVSLTQTLAIEWAKHGVCVNAIAPGVFRTSMNAALLDGTARGKEFLTRTPMGRFGNIDELVGGSIFLASEAASFVTGIVLPIDGGFLASGVNQ